jgi:hypothetical protein
MYINCKSTNDEVYDNESRVVFINPIIIIIITAGSKGVPGRKGL